MFRYKGDYEPSFLNCPETYNWYPIKSVEKKLDDKKYCRFAPEHQGTTSWSAPLESFGKFSFFLDDRNKVTSPNDVMVLYKRQAMPFSVFRLMKDTDEDEVLEYAGFVGKSCSKRMLLYRS